MFLFLSYFFCIVICGFVVIGGVFILVVCGGGGGGDGEFSGGGFGNGNLVVNVGVNVIVMEGVIYLLSV